MLKKNYPCIVFWINHRSDILVLNSIKFNDFWSYCKKINGKNCVNQANFLLTSNVIIENGHQMAAKTIAWKCIRRVLYQNSNTLNVFYFVVENLRFDHVSVLLWHCDQIHKWRSANSITCILQPFIIVKHRNALVAWVFGVVSVMKYLDCFFPFIINAESLKCAHY